MFGHCNTRVGSISLFDVINIAEVAGGPEQLGRWWGPVSEALAWAHATCRVAAEASEMKAAIAYISIRRACTGVAACVGGPNGNPNALASALA